MAYQTTTLAQLQTLLAQRYEGSPFWTADQARRAINEGLRIYNLITGMYRTATTQALIPDDNHLYVGGTLVKGTRVQIGGQTLTLTSINALDRAIPNWQGVNTASGGSTPSAPAFWAPVGLTEIVVYPKEAPPGQSACTVSGVRNTPLLVNPGDYLNLGDEEISALLGYALHVLSFAKGIEALQKTRPLMVAFFKTCALKNAQFEASSLYRKVVGYDRLRSAQPMVDGGAVSRAEALESVGTSRTDRAAANLSAILGGGGNE